MRPRSRSAKAASCRSVACARSRSGSRIANPAWAISSNGRWALTAALRMERMEMTPPLDASMARTRTEQRARRKQQACRSKGLGQKMRRAVDT
eukprot:11406788-Alexandrium_andersonii.AAC.1